MTGAEEARRALYGLSDREVYAVAISFWVHAPTVFFKAVEKIKQASQSEGDR